MLNRVRFYSLFFLYYIGSFIACFILMAVTMTDYTLLAVLSLSSIFVLAYISYRVALRKSSAKVEVKIEDEHLLIRRSRDTREKRGMAKSVLYNLAIADIRALQITYWRQAPATISFRTRTKNKKIRVSERLFGRKKAEGFADIAEQLASLVHK